MHIYTYVYICIYIYIYTPLYRGQVIGSDSTDGGDCGVAKAESKWSLKAPGRDSLHAYIHMYMYIYIYIYRERERDAYIYAYIYIYIHRERDVYTCTYMCIYTSLSLSLYIYVYIYIHTYIYIYICIERRNNNPCRSLEHCSTWIARQSNKWSLEAPVMRVVVCYLMERHCIWFIVMMSFEMKGNPSK